MLCGIKSPDGVICSFGGHPAVDSQFYRNEGGPFANEVEYNECLISDLVGTSIIPDMLCTQMRTDHEIVLTHGDLHAINIMVRAGEGVVAVINWELAGFYSEYHDLLQPFRPAGWQCGYYKELLNILSQRYDAEFVVDQIVHVEQTLITGTGAQYRQHISNLKAENNLFAQ